MALEAELARQRPLRYVLFVCTHNAGRSQMAQAFFERYGPEDVVAESAGTEPTAEISPVVVEVMREFEIGISGRRPKDLSVEMQLHADWAVTMGCGDACPYVASAVEAWDIPDPAGRPIEEVRPIRDGIEAHVRELLATRLQAIRTDRTAHQLRLARLLPMLVKEFADTKPAGEIRACADAVLQGFEGARVRSHILTLAPSDPRLPPPRDLPHDRREDVSARIGINGFGRMGRLALRAAWGWPELSFVHINELNGEASTAAHLLTFDSIHGRWSADVRGDGDTLAIDGTALGYSSRAEPGAVPWGKLGVEIVLECSGRFRTEESLDAYFEQGVRKVIVAAPVRGRALNVVVGVNDDLYDSSTHDVLTAASCTTNCLAPVVKVIHEGIGIRHGQITTLHDMTNTQVVLDAPHRDLRRARASSLSLIPTTTGSATAIGLIFPELQGKLNGLAVRVPTLNASLTDCVFEVERPTTVEEVNGLLRGAADGPLAGILGYEERPLVSVDYRDDPRSGIVDALSTMVTDETQVKVLAWYDNEWGYANRLVELAREVAGSLTSDERFTGSATAADG